MYVKQIDSTFPRVQVESTLCHLSLSLLYSGFYSGLTVTNRASSISENEPYSEVKELDHLDKKEDSMQRENQNPYYHTLEPSDTVVNPIYERFVISLFNNYCKSGR